VGHATAATVIKFVLVSSFRSNRAPPQNGKAPGARNSDRARGRSWKSHSAEFWMYFTGESDAADESARVALLRTKSS
jgi:hypothetical protein